MAVVHAAHQTVWTMPSSWWDTMTRLIYHFGKSRIRGERDVEKKRLVSGLDERIVGESNPNIRFCRGEDGYFRVAQTAIAGDYGLFGVLAEGTIVQAQNVTAQVQEEAQTVPFPWWAILAIVLGSLTLCLCMFCTCRWFRSSKDQYIPEQQQQQY